MPLSREQFLKYRRVTIMGLGLFGGGVGVARWFSHLGAAVTVTDTADVKKLARSVQALEGLPITLHLGGHSLDDFINTDLVVANQAVRPENEFLAAARKAGVPITTETGIALGLNRAPWVGVTGSSGKSTTSALLAAMLTRHDTETLFGGNIGGDLISRVENIPQGAPLVAELSSFQLMWLQEEFAAGRATPPAVAVVTNITPNHLDWHKDMSEYEQTKFSLPGSQNANNWTVLNVTDSLLAHWADKCPARVIRCSSSGPQGPDTCWLEENTIRIDLDGRPAARLSLDRFRLLGAHNKANALQAAAAAFVMSKFDLHAVQEGLDSFAALPHRLEYAGNAAGRTYINDSKSTTPEAAITALAAMEGPVTLIAGGYDKRSPFEALAKAIQQRADSLVIIGAAGPRLLEAVIAAAADRPTGRPPLKTENCGEDFVLALKTATRITPEGGTILLSPACASYGMFVNYEQRGEQFKTWVAEQAKEQSTGLCR